MTENIQSPFLLAKRLSADVLHLLVQIDASELAIPEQQKLERLKNALIDARLEIQDYELAETRDNQLRNAKNAQKYLAKIKNTITDSDLNVFGAVDVAHLSAQVEQIIARLR